MPTHTNVINEADLARYQVGNTVTHTTGDTTARYRITARTVHTAQRCLRHGWGWQAVFVHITVTVEPVGSPTRTP